MQQSYAQSTVTVLLPSPLRGRTGNRVAVAVAPGTVREVIDQLDAAYPGLRFNLCQEAGELRPFVNIFVGDRNIRFASGLDTPVPAGATLAILQSVAGG